MLLLSRVVLSRPAEDGASRGPQSELAESWALMGLLAVGLSRDVGHTVPPTAATGCVVLTGLSGTAEGWRDWR